MRILLCALNHAPEPVGIGKYMGEMAAWLAGRGHEVRVVAAPPYYPEWRVRPGHSAWRYRREEIDGVRVYRCPLWVPRRPGGLSRVLHLASFAESSLPVLLLQALDQRPQVVGLVAPPLACAPGVLAAARLAGAAAWLHVQDFEVDAAFRLGLLPPNLIWALPRRVLEGAERGLMRRFDLVSTLSPRMREHLDAKGVAAERTAVVPNWIDTGAVRPLDGASPLRAELGIGAATTVALYAGNMAEKQGLEVAVAAARRLAGEDVLFVLCGAGPARERLVAAAEGVANLRFLPLQPAERLNDLLNLADIHLLPQRGEAAGLVMPSKLAGMLASGRPVVATAPAEAELAREVAGCGIAVAPDDAGALAEAVLALARNPERRAALGSAGRRRAQERWERTRVLAALEARLVRLAESRAKTAKPAAPSE